MDVGGLIAGKIARGLVCMHLVFFVASSRARDDAAEQVPHTPTAYRQ